VTGSREPLRRHPFAYWLLRETLRLLCVVFFRLTSRGREQVPRRGACIIAPNHASFLDPLVVGIAVPRQIHYMARHDLWDNRRIAWFLNASNSFPVRREGVAGEAFKRAIRLLEQGEAVLVFPEGGRSLDGRIGGAQAGVGMLARMTGAPVIPVAVIGADRALPPHARMIRLARVRVVFGAPIVPPSDAPPREQRRAAYQRLADEVIEAIREIHGRYSVGPCGRGEGGGRTQ